MTRGILEYTIMLLSKRRLFFLVAVPAFLLFFFAELQHLRHARDVRSKEDRLTFDEVLRRRRRTRRDDDNNNNYTLPRLESILDNTTIIGDPQPLLQFAIIGFGKSGTTTLNFWLREHEELQVLKSEVYALVGDEPDRLIRRLHRKLPENKKRGYKCPGDILSGTAMSYYRQYWPKTKLFVAVRHPVLWMQSLYNFRVQNFKTYAEMPHPNFLIGRCFEESKLACSQRGHIGYHLMRLGKQNVDGVKPFSDLEYEIMNFYPSEFEPPENLIYTPNEVFLVELNQLGDSNQTRKAQLAADIQDYLDLTKPLPDMVHFTPGKQWEDAVQADRDRYKIDICHEEYIPLRRELMMIARMASRWIRETFLDLPGVHYSSREYLEELLLSWNVDPCGPYSDWMSKEEGRRVLNRTLGQVLDGDEVKDLVNHVWRDQRLSSAVNVSVLLEKRPPIDQVIDRNGTFIGDPQPYLDWAVPGFGKCGTSTILFWLEDHPEVQAIPSEKYYLMRSEPHKLVERLAQLPAGNFRYGYKAPTEIGQPHVMRYYKELFPKTKLFIGVRHPIDYFVSLYNFRCQNIDTFAEMLHPNDLVGGCYASSKRVCTRKAHFAHDLLQLGKHVQNGSRPFTDLERTISEWYDKTEFTEAQMVYLPNEIFFFDLEQLKDTNETRKARFRESVERFLGLTVPLPDVIHFKPGKVWEDPSLQQAKDAKKIKDICDVQYVPIRYELIQLARHASLWIRSTFLDAPGVHVANRQHLESILEGWMVDPCGNATDTMPEDEMDRIYANTTVFNPERRRPASIIGRVAEDDKRPPLNQVIGANNSIIGDVQPFLDWSIIGFGKCGTSTMLYWLIDHPEVQALPSERYELMRSEPYNLVRKLAQLPAGDVRYGYKCPNEIGQSHIMDFYRTLWPKTKLFVGIRHPIDYFVSLYNFRVQNLRTFLEIPHPNKLIGGCFAANKKICTRKAHFAYYLLKLGKQFGNGTRPFTKLESTIAGWYQKDKVLESDIQPMPNEVFLFDLEQFKDQNETRQANFRTAIQDFLNLTVPLPKVIHFTPGKEWEDEELQKAKDAKKISDICERQYVPIRLELLNLARQASLWIRTIFLDSPGVYVANREHLESVLEGWMNDPCGNATDTMADDEIERIFQETTAVK